jgi:hypothetical protein
VGEGEPDSGLTRFSGHKTTEIVLKHYFQPGREDFRQALQSAMPKLLTNGHKSPKDEIRKVIEKLKGKGLKKTKERLLALLGEGLVPAARLIGECAARGPSRTAAALWFKVGVVNR